MTFDIQDYYRLSQLLREHPEFREEMRRMLLSDEILTLPELVRELAAAQKRTEERVEELAAAQKRTEERIEELAAAQKRTDERLDQLSAAVQELAAAQKRTEERVEALEGSVGRLERRVGNLEVGVQNLRKEVAGLAATIGSSLEEEAGSVLEYVMRHKGYRLLGEAQPLRWDGEVDVLLSVEDAQGQRLTVVAEAKARLSRRDALAWASRMKSEGFRRQLAEMGYPGPYLVYVHAIRADSAAREAVVETGIGLTKGDGEIIAPQGWIE